jgi:hypothetical protein
MDNAIVKRALRALADIGAARPTMPELPRKKPELAYPVPVSQHKVAEKPEAQSNGLAPCGSSDCAGCYDVGDGRRIHPPKCDEKYRVEFERWEARGRVQ